MIKINNELYLKEEMKENIDEIKNNIKSGIIPKDMYFICISENENDAFDIYSSFEFSKKIALEKDRVVAGMAYSKVDAMNIVEFMIAEYMNENNKTETELSLRQYYLNK